MKIKFFILLCLLCNFSKIQCQDAINAIGGYNYSGVVWTDYTESGWGFKSGYFIGLENVKNINERLDFVSSLQYSTKGWLKLADGSSNSYNYIDLINQLSYHPFSDVNINVGLNTGYLTNEKSVLADSKFDLGFIIGAGLNIKRFQFYIQYNQGIIDTRLYEAQSSNRKVVNNNFQFGVGYRLYQNKNSIHKIKTPKTREFGVEFSTLNSFRFVYKKQIKDNKLATYRIGYNNINIAFVDNEENSTRADLNLGIGIENRVSFAQQFYFTHGVDPSIGFSYITNERKINIVPSLGYRIGFLYEIKPTINCGLNFRPSINTNFNFFGALPDRDLPIQLELQSNVNLFFAYRLLTI